MNKLTYKHIYILKNTKIHIYIYKKKILIKLNHYHGCIFYYFLYFGLWFDFRINMFNKIKNELSIIRIHKKYDINYSSVRLKLYITNGSPYLVLFSKNTNKKGTKKNSSSDLYIIF